MCGSGKPPAPCYGEPANRTLRSASSAPCTVKADSSTSIRTFTSLLPAGLDIRHSVWRDIFFKKHAVEEIWCRAVIWLLRHSHDLINPGSLPGLGRIRDKTQ